MIARYTEGCNGDQTGECVVESGHAVPNCVLDAQMIVPSFGTADGVLRHHLVGPADAGGRGGLGQRRREDCARQSGAE